MGLAERFKIGIFMGQFFQIMIQFDSPPDVAMSGGQIAPLGRIATQIELDQRILGMKGGGFGKNFGGRVEGVAAALGKSPSHEPAGLVGMGGSELGGERGGLGPALSPFQKTELKLHDTAVSGHGGGQARQFIQSVCDHAEVRVTDGRFSPSKIFPKFN